MPNLQVFDRINSLNAYKLRSMPFEKYFGEMPLSKEQKEERISLAREIEETMIFFFWLMILQAQYEQDMDVKTQLSDRLHGAVGRHTEMTDDIEDHISEFVDDVERVTALHLATLIVLTDEVEKDIEESEKETEEKEKKLKSEEYWLSDDRARFIAEEESNTIFNSADFEEAKERGYTTKTWVTMADERVRKSHRKMEGVTVPIDEYFMVGNSLMMYPRDPAGDPEEVINCRCWMEFE